MVLLRVQRDENVQFAIQTTCATQVDEVCAASVRLHNLLRRMHRVCSAAEILVTAELRVIEAAAKLMAAAQQPGENEAQHDEPRDGIASSNTDGAANSESSGDGTGAGVGAPAVRHAEPEQLQRLTVAVQALIHLCHKDRAAEKAVVQEEVVESAAQAVRAAAAAAFPDGMPEGLDSLAADLEGRDEVVLGENGLPKADGPLAVEDAVLWFVGKRLDGCATVGACIGRHENTVATVKLMVAHEGRPVKGKNVTPQLEDEMMAYAYKKQAIWKELEADEGLEYLDSGWADTRDLKRTLNGVGAIRLM